jgi:hypothetical protein
MPVWSSPVTLEIGIAHASPEGAQTPPIDVLYTPSLQFSLRTVVSL